MNTKKRLSALLCLLLACTLLIIAALPVSAAGPTVTTTLVDGAVQRGSKKTFDVWARNASGEKIKATVRLNGDKVEPTWDDNEKTSYTLVFTSEGANTVTVTATSDGGRRRELTYTIYYRQAADGEAIGTAVWSVEAFTLGCGYIVYPMYVPIYEGETAAAQLVRMLSDCGYVSYCGGSLDSAFYLAYIADGTSGAARYNNYARFGSPSSPRSLDIVPSIPSMLVPHLESTMTYFDPDDYANWSGHLGEFVISNGSGWMYSVNNIFPNVGFADCYLSDGDVVRVQFTLGYGADIGGFGAMGTEIPDVDVQPSGGYFAVADKDVLTRAICEARASGLLDRENVGAAYEHALSVAAQLDASSSAVSSAASALRSAVADPSAVKTPDTTGGNSGNHGGSNQGTDHGSSGDNSSSGDHGGSGNGSSSGSNGSSGSTSGSHGSTSGSGSGSTASGTTGSTVFPGISGGVLGGSSGKGSSAIGGPSIGSSALTELPDPLKPENILGIGSGSGSSGGALSGSNSLDPASGSSLPGGKDGTGSGHSGSTSGSGSGDDGAAGRDGGSSTVVVCVILFAVIACTAVCAVIFRKKLAALLAPIAVRLPLSRKADPAGKLSGDDERKLSTDAAHNSADKAADDASSAAESEPTGDTGDTSDGNDISSTDDTQDELHDAENESADSNNDDTSETK